MTAFAVGSGSAMAMFFGTSSPNTMDSTVATTSATTTPIESPTSGATPSHCSGVDTRLASEGSVTKPSASVVTVMPTWAPESWVDSERRPIISDFAWVSPSAACRATVARSTVTRLNSAET